ncbi:MAG: OmpA family protein [bacterium]|nr:OmpA family protein [bacterium]
MMKKISILLIFFLSLSFQASGQEKFSLFWDFKLNQTFTIDKYTKQTIKKNGILVRKADIRDYVRLIPFEQKGDITSLKGEYNSYIKSLETTDPYELTESYGLNFGMDKKGQYYIDKKYTMPSIRNIPLFPAEPVASGEVWEGTGIEILEFEPRITLPVDVFYQLAGREEKLEKECVKIVFHYLFNHTVEHNYPDVPYKFLGASYSALWYDIREHLPVYTENSYDIMFIYRDGTFIQYKGDLTGYYNLKRKTEEKERVKEELYDKFMKSEKDMNAEKKEDSVVLDLGEVYFEFNKAVLTPEAREKLKRVGEILKKYDNLDLVFKGHTDDIGSDEYNLKLSQDRARSVLDFLIKNKYLKENQGAYTGAGKKEPKASNRTEEGRSRNRRVEIIIKPE